jgi:hypothetical protein
MGDKDERLGDLLAVCRTVNDDLLLMFKWLQNAGDIPTALFFVCLQHYRLACAIVKAEASQPQPEKETR